MCGCENNVVDLQQLKIYMIMAEYKAKLSSGTTYKDGVKIKWAIVTQEELAHAYEVLGLTTHVEKIEKTKTRKTDAKKVSKDKEETNESEKESGKDKEDQE